MPRTKGLSVPSDGASSLKLPPAIKTAILTRKPFSPLRWGKLVETIQAWMGVHGQMFFQSPQMGQAR